MKSILPLEGPSEGWIGLGFLVLPVEAGGVGWCRNKTGKVLVLWCVPRSIGATQKPAFLSDLNTLPS